MKQIEELGEKIASDEKSKLEDLIAKLEDAVASERYSEMQDRNENIKNYMMEIGQKVYSQNPDMENSTSNSAGDDVIETDFSTEK